eukprot:2128587-Rhodomonas_salina.3
MATQIAHGNGGRRERPAKRARASATTYHTPQIDSTTSKYDSVESDRDMEREEEPEYVVGIAVVWGTPMRRVSCSPAELDAALLRSVQTDKPKIISFLIRAHGWRPDGARTNCSFGITIDKASAAERSAKIFTGTRDGAEAPATNTSSSTSAEQVWRVSSATPLHWALSCGSFKAAAVLLVAFPEFATLVRAL